MSLLSLLPTFLLGFSFFSYWFLRIYILDTSPLLVQPIINISPTSWLFTYLWCVYLNTQFFNLM